MTKLAIPEQLKWYTPLGLQNSQSELSIAWCTSVDDMTGCIEIKRAPFVKLSAALCGIMIGTFATGILSLVYIFDLGREDAEPLLVSIMFSVLPFTIFLLVALDAFCTLLNSRYWKGSLRFRFDPHNPQSK